MFPGLPERGQPWAQLRVRGEGLPEYGDATRGGPHARLLPQPRAELQEQRSPLRIRILGARHRQEDHHGVSNRSLNTILSTTRAKFAIPDPESYFQPFGISESRSEHANASFFESWRAKFGVIPDSYFVVNT